MFRWQGHPHPRISPHIRLRTPQQPQGAHMLLASAASAAACSAGGCPLDKIKNPRCCLCRLLRRHAASQRASQPASRQRGSSCSARATMAQQLASSCGSPAGDCSAGACGGMQAQAGARNQVGRMMLLAHPVGRHALCSAACCNGMWAHQRLHLQLLCRPRGWRPLRCPPDMR